MGNHERRKKRVEVGGVSKEQVEDEWGTIER